MRHHVRPRPQVADKLRAQIQVGAVTKIKHDDAGLAEIICKQVALDKLNTIGHASLGGIFPAFLNQLRVDLDSHRPACAKVANGGNDNAPVTRTQIIHHVVRADIGQPE